MPRNKTIDIAQVAELFREGQSIMVGGFGRGGAPFTLIDFLATHADTYKGLTIYKNDGSEPDLGVGRLFKTGQVKKLVATHIGLNPDFIAMMNKGEVACDLIPQGIFAEKIRAGGAGIPAFYSDIGLGTVYAEGKDKVRLDGKEYILERSFRADVAIVCADRVDTFGNCWWKGTNRNTCVAMATACDKTIVEAKEIVEAGVIQPEDVHLSGIFVNAVVQAGPRRHIA